MIKEQQASILNSLFRFLRRKLSLFMVACMLGVSNVILEEERMVHDTRAKVEEQAVHIEDD